VLIFLGPTLMAGSFLIAALFGAGAARNVFAQQAKEHQENGRGEHEEHEDMLEWVGGRYDPHAFDYPDIAKQLTESSIPHLLIETEIQPTSVEQVRTRLQAFVEMLKEKKNG